MDNNKQRILMNHRKSLKLLSFSPTNSRPTRNLSVELRWNSLHANARSETCDELNQPEDFWFSVSSHFLLFLIHDSDSDLKSDFSSPSVLWPTCFSGCESLSVRSPKPFENFIPSELVCLNPFSYSDTVDQPDLPVTPHRLPAIAGWRNAFKERPVSSFIWWLPRFHWLVMETRGEERGSTGSVWSAWW